MNPSVAKKASRAVRLLMMVLTAVLIFFFINVMLLVSDIQGTVRVVNYAGLVRGTTQRIVKLEDAGQPQDDLLKAVDSYINGLRYGSDDLNLVRLDDDEYQAKMTDSRAILTSFEPRLPACAKSATRTPTSSP